jgi:spore germination protein GerM
MKMTKLIFAVALLAVGFSSATAQKTELMTIKLYFGNERLNPNWDDCNKVFPVTRRIPKTTAVATAALQELFKGTTKDEEAKQYSSFSPKETEGILKSVNVKNGAAYVNFTKRVYEQMGTATTSCGGGFFAMVDETLYQFPTIKKVYYAIEGNTNDFYEWVQVGECPYGRKHCSSSNFK